MEVVTKEISQELIAEIGEGKVDDCKPTLIAYRVAHGIEGFLHDLDYFTPGAVVWPETVEDVQKIVEIANKTKVPIVPVGGRTVTYGPESMKGCIMVDVARMNKVIEFDESKLRVTAEAGIRIADLTEYLANRGYMLLEMPTLSKTAQLGSRAALHGYNKFENRWGSSGNYIKGLEVVLPTGEVVQVGRGTNGIKIPAKAVTAYDTMNLFIGSRGTLGVITKVVEKVIKTPTVTKYNAMAFKTKEDGIKAYVEIRNLSHSTGCLWRAKGIHKTILIHMTRDMVGGKQWPEDLEWLTEYMVVGEPEVVEATEKYVLDICKKYNGFWRDDLPPTTFIGEVHKSAEQYMGSGSVGTDRLKNGGTGDRIVPFDPNIPDAKLLEFFDLHNAHVNKMNDVKAYPHLAGKMRVFDLISTITSDEAFTKWWWVLLSNWEDWDENVRKEFIAWYREYAELIWQVGGALSATHGFIPREIEIEMVKKEIGENEYMLMKRIKDALDPNHIMNPKVRFEY